LVELNPQHHEVTIGGTPIRLRPKEFSLLAYLIAHQGLWITEQRILEEALGTTSRHQTGLVRVHVSSLRKALLGHASRLESRRGCGYRWVARSAQSSIDGGPQTQNREL
jgi:DNA-binding response OmpR family regulator